MYVSVVGVRHVTYAGQKMGNERQDLGAHSREVLHCRDKEPGKGRRSALPPGPSCRKMGILAVALVVLVVGLPVHPNLIIKHRLAYQHDRLCVRQG